MLPEAPSVETNLGAALLEVGRKAFKSRAYEQSEGVLLDALAAGADEEECRLHLARIYNLRSDWASALEHWSWLRERDPSKIEPALQVARAQFRLKHYEEAGDLFKAVLGLEPGHAEASHRLQQIPDLIGTVSVSPPATLETAMLTPEPMSPPTLASAIAGSESDLLEEGRIAFKAEDFVRSEEIIRRALAGGADPAVCRLYLARIFNHNANWLEALEQWSWLRDRSPAKLEPQLQVARSQYRLKRPLEALAGFRAVLALAPDHEEARRRVGEIGVRFAVVPASPPAVDPPVFRVEGAPASTLPSPAAAVAAVPHSVVGGGALDVVALQEGRDAFKVSDFERSEAAFLRALASGLDERDCRLHLARIYNHCGEWAKALEQWQWLRDNEPSQLEPLLQVARALNRLKRHTEALAGFRAVLVIAPEQEEARRRVAELAAPQQLTAELESKPSAAALDSVSSASQDDVLDRGRVAFREGDFERAEAAFVSAIEKRHDEPVARLYLARIHNNRGQWSKALEQWEWLLNERPQELEPRLQVARARFSIGEIAGAAQAFRSVLEFDPEHAEAKSRIDEIKAILGEADSAGGGESWASVIPAEHRWQIAVEAIFRSLVAVEAAIEDSRDTARALSGLVAEFAETRGQLEEHRGLFGLQLSPKLADLERHLDEAKLVAGRSLKRTDRIHSIIRKLVGKGMIGPNPARPTVSPAKDIAEAAFEIFRKQGLNAALSWVFGAGNVNVRPLVLKELGCALAAVDRSAALQALWLSSYLGREEHWVHVIAKCISELDEHRPVNER